MLLALIKIIVFLPLVTALAYFLIKYGLARHPLALGGKRRMRLVEQIPLSPKSYVSLVEVGGRYILLAHSENGFQIISEMDELPEPILPQDNGAAGFMAAYRNIKMASGENQLLDRLLFRKGKER
jgi:flagellar protein FliO/FliZ